MKIGNIKTNGGTLPLLAGAGAGAGIGIVCRYYYSEDYLIPYVNYTMKTDVLIPGAVGAFGIIAGLIMKSSKRYLMLGLGIGGISTAVVNYFVPKTETSYMTSSGLSCCGNLIIS